MITHEWKVKTILIIVVIAFLIISGIQFYGHRHYKMPIVAGPGVTKVTRFSDYSPGLKGTMADTDVFFLEGKEKGETTVS